MAHSHPHTHANTPCSPQEAEAFLLEAEQMVEAKGQKLTRIRRKVLHLLLESEEPAKAYDLLANLDGEGAAKPPTVYRALDFLMTAGLVHKVEALNAFVGCSHAHDDGGAELFICSTCGSVEERHGAPEPVNAPAGFMIQRSVVEHFGQCANCRPA